jgi:hypothetical protein
MLVNHLMGEHTELELPSDAETEPEPEPAPLGDAPVPAWLAEARQAKQENGK